MHLGAKIYLVAGIQSNRYSLLFHSGRLAEISLGNDVKPLHRASNRRVIKLYSKLDFI